MCVRSRNCVVGGLKYGKTDSNLDVNFRTLWTRAAGVTLMSLVQWEEQHVLEKALELNVLCSCC